MPVSHRLRSMPENLARQVEKAVWAGNQRSLVPRTVLVLSRHEEGGGRDVASSNISCLAAVPTRSPELPGFCFLSPNHGSRASSWTARMITRSIIRVVKTIPVRSSMGESCSPLFWKVMGYGVVTAYAALYSHVPAAVTFSRRLPRVPGRQPPCRETRPATASSFAINDTARMSGAVMTALSSADPQP